MTIATERLWVRDLLWRTRVGKRCRWMMKHRKACGRPAVAESQRGTQWWGYCGGHLYRRRIDANGAIWVAVHPDSPAAIRGYAKGRP